MDRYPVKACILVGHVLDELKKLPDESVHCIVTSPPYFGLRDYKTKSVNWSEVEYAPMSGLSSVVVEACDASLGAEPSPEQYVGHLVLVARELKRVLRKDGTFWLNMGDSYAAKRTKQVPQTKWKNHDFGDSNAPKIIPVGLKQKDLMGIPWRVVLALQADGWYLRSDVIWNKTNAMPQSVTDRPTRAHEYLFLLTKSKRYYYDCDAIREPHRSSGKVVPWQERKYDQSMLPDTYHQNPGKHGGVVKGRPHGIAGFGKGGRNKRSVWSFPTRPFKGAHFAVFPPALVEPCILAGTSEYGCCPECGMPCKRIVQRGLPSKSSSRPQQRRAAELWEEYGLTDAHLNAIRAVGSCDATYGQATMTGYGKNLDDVQKLAHEAKQLLKGYYCEFLSYSGETVGWEPVCDCGCKIVHPCVVLDPFFGAGTTALVALKHGRRIIGIELNFEYAKLAERRIEESLQGV